MPLAHVFLSLGFGSFRFALEFRTIPIIWSFKITTALIASSRILVVRVDKTVVAIFVLLLVSRLAGLALVFLALAVLVLDVCNQALLRAVVVIRIDHIIDCFKVILLAHLRPPEILVRLMTVRLALRAEKVVSLSLLTARLCCLSWLLQL